MLDFDFINVEDFRLSLEADYAELEVAMKNEAWKTVQILAGSIIEAILIDYLVFSDYQEKTSKDPLRMSLISFYIVLLNHTTYETYCHSS